MAGILDNIKNNYKSNSKSNDYSVWYGLKLVMALFKSSNGKERAFFLLLIFLLGKKITWNVCFLLLLLLNFYILHNLKADN